MNKSGSESEEDNVASGSTEGSVVSAEEVSPVDLAEEHINKLLNLLSTQTEYESIDKLRNKLRLAGNRDEGLKQKMLDYKSGAENRIDKSRIQINELHRMARELISNVATLSHKRHLVIKQNVMERVAEMKKSIERETLESLAEIKEMESKWTELAPYNSDVIRVFDYANVYRDKVQKILGSKDKLIKQCEDEHERMTMYYDFLINRQQHELNVMKERFNAQMQIFITAYKEHIEMLDKVLIEEREILTNKFVNRFHLNMKSLHSMNERILAIDRNKTDIYFASIAQLAKKEHDVTTVINMCLNKETEKLQMELRKFKVDTFMQSEIMDYNAYVLKTRNEESYLVNNQQNLRITKINDSIFKLRQQFNSKNRENTHKINALRKRVESLHANITRHEQHGLATKQKNATMLKKMWAFHIGEVQPLVCKFIEIERLLYEQHLKLPWNPPKLDLSEFIGDDANAGDVEESLKKFQSQLMQNTKKSELTKTEHVSTLDKRFLRNIMRAIGGRKGGFFQEKFRKLLQSFSKDAKCLVEVNNVFASLHITEAKEIDSLVEVFKPYSWCPNCSRDMGEELVKRLYENGEQSLTACFTSTERRRLESSAVHCKNHYLITDSMFAMKALRDFVTSRHQKSADEAIARITVDVPDIEEIKCFWKLILDYLPEKKLELWNWFEHGLIHYLENLKEREQLDRECHQLRQQNKELKHLLQNFHK